MELPVKLKENEYLLKIRPKDDYQHKFDTGFLAKYNKNGSMQISFANWGVYKYSAIKEEPLPITLHIEDFKSGWEIVSWRFGMSQNWATMKHPNGFTVEIYLSDLLEICKENVISYGVLEGEFKWKAHKLIKKL